MNIRTLHMLPLSLLLSTAAYAMDGATANPEQLKDEQEEITLTLAEKKDAAVDALVLDTVQSTILPSTQPAKVQPAKAKETVATKSATATVQSKKLGVMTGFKDSVYGVSATVSHEIAHNKFDGTIPGNHRRLSKGLEELTLIASADNLRTLKTTLGNCQSQGISVDDSTVIQLVRKFGHAMRGSEEKQLSDEANLALQNAEKARTALIANVAKVVAASIDEAKAIDKKLGEDLDAAYKKHDETILLGTEVKRLTRKVNKNMPADEYDSDSESKYDRPFNAKKLELEEPTALNHKLNKRVADNFEIIKNAVEIAAQKSIKQHDITSPITQLAPQQQ